MLCVPSFDCRPPQAVAPDLTASLGQAGSPGKGRLGAGSGRPPVASSRDKARSGQEDLLGPTAPAAVGFGARLPALHSSALSCAFSTSLPQFPPV